LLRQREGQVLDEHDMSELVEKLTSQLYFHGHPINRNEARNDLRLSFVVDATPEEEEAMWALYSAYSEDMRLNEEFQPVQEAYARQPVGVPPPPPMAGPGQFGATVPIVANVIMDPVKSAYVECTERGDVHQVQFEVTLRREWTGEVNGNVFASSSAWSVEASSAPAAAELEPEQAAQEAQLGGQADQTAEQPPDETTS
jgi:hypothetical protein